MWGVARQPPCLSNLLLSLKLECEKLASEKTEMQRHYVMVRYLPTSMLSLNRASWDVLHCFYGCFPLPTPHPQFGGLPACPISLSPTVIHLVSSLSGSPWGSGRLPPSRGCTPSVSPGWHQRSTPAVSFAVLRDVLRTQH